MNYLDTSLANRGNLRGGNGVLQSPSPFLKLYDEALVSDASL